MSLFITYITDWKKLSEAKSSSERFCDGMLKWKLLNLQKKKAKDKVYKHYMNSCVTTQEKNYARGLKVPTCYLF